MEIIYTFIVDFAHPQRSNELMVMQNDAKTRVARFVLMNGSKPFDVTDVDAVTVNAVLPDESRITAEIELSLDEDENPINEALFRIPATITRAIGKTVATISLYKAAVGTTEPELLSSFEFYINTRNELNTEDEDEEDDMAGLRDLLERAAEAIETVEQIVSMTALPNPYPLRILLEEATYNYNGERMITINFGNVLTRLQTIEQAFPAGCRQIAAAVTANGVSTSDNAGVSTIVTNIGKIRQDGNAGAAQILTGYNAWVNKVKVNGSMPNRGSVTLTPTGDNTATGEAGYYTQVIANGRASYAAGVSQGHDDVTQSPGSYGLYTAAQYSANRTAGRNDVLNHPGDYDLYTEAQYDQHYLDGVAAGAAGVSNTRIIQLSGSASSNADSKIDIGTDLRISISATVNGISASVVSGSVYGTASHWVDDDFVSPVSDSFVPSIS